MATTPKWPAGESSAETLSSPYTLVSDTKIKLRSLDNSPKSAQDEFTRDNDVGKVKGTSSLDDLRQAGVTSRPSPEAHPDGGIQAWIQVICGYLLFMNTWGIVNTFGEFQTYYSTDLLAGTSNSTIAWIGTLTSFLLCASPISWGPIFDLGNARVLVLGGSLSVVFGLMMTSLCSRYWQFILAQGICIGIGGGCAFLTATSILPAYFTKQRALAMGLAASGSSLGGIIYPVIFHQLQPHIGFGWAVRVIGFIATATLAIPCAFIKPRSKPTGRRKIFDTAILKEVEFEMFNIATFFGFVGQYIPFFFIQQYAGEHGLGLAFWMLAFLNVGSIPGRIVPSLIADRYFHPLLVLSFCTGCAALLGFCWIGVQDSTAGLVIWAILYGFFSGAFVSLQGPAIASMTSNLSTIGTRFGINMFCGACGILIGSPVAGAIFPVSWAGAQIFCGSTLILSSATVLSTYLLFKHKSRRKVNSVHT